MRKCFVDLYWKPKKCKEIWDLRLSQQNFPVHLLVYKTSFIFCKTLLHSHCETAWLQTNAVSLQSLVVKTPASRFPLAQPDDSEWAVPLMNQYRLVEGRSITEENLKVASEGISPEVASLATVLFLSWEKENIVSGHDHASPWGPSLRVEVQDNTSLFQSLGSSVSPPEFPSLTGQRKTSSLTYKTSLLQTTIQLLQCW